MIEHIDNNDGFENFEKEYLLNFDSNFRWYKITGT